MDEHMMNLFSIIAGEVRNRQDLFDNEGKIMQALLNRGCRLYEADAALTLMQNLVQKEDDDLQPKRRTVPVSAMRMMNRMERDRFTPEAFSFVAKLAHLGIVSPEQQEEILEQAMSAYSDRIELEHIKSVVTFMLFSGASEGETGPSGIKRMKKTAWN